MSAILRKVADFLKLLLETSKQQARALVYTLTPLQAAAICEILFNLKKLPLTSRVVKELRKRKLLITRLTDKNVSVKRKLALIQDHYRQILATLQLIKSDLLSMLE